MSELTSLTIAQARQKLLAKEITSTELTQAYLAAIDGANERFNAYVTVTADIARERAASSDERIAKGEGRRWSACARSPGSSARSLGGGAGSPPPALPASTAL
ncbi:MAG: hypothetical protein AAF412_14920, partial [Pseudomonadota bacterium]